LSSVMSGILVTASSFRGGLGVLFSAFSIDPAQPRPFPCLGYAVGASMLIHATPG
jgi:hypothetical protein